MPDWVIDAVTDGVPEDESVADGEKLPEGELDGVCDGDAPNDRDALVVPEREGDRVGDGEEERVGV